MTLAGATRVWRIARRTLRPLDGSEPARALLLGALEKFKPTH